MATIEERLAALETKAASFTTPTHAEVLNSFVTFANKQQLKLDQELELFNGTATGGPNGDGKYPITDKTGFVRLVTSQARRDFDSASFRYATYTGVGPFTMVVGDNGKVIRIGNGTSTPNLAVRLPNLPLGTNFMFKQIGAGRLSFAATGGTVVFHRQNFTLTAGRGAVATAFVDEVINGVAQWTLAGDLVANA